MQTHENSTTSIVDSQIDTLPNSVVQNSTTTLTSQNVPNSTENMTEHNPSESEGKHLLLDSMAPTCTVTEESLENRLNSHWSTIKNNAGNSGKNDLSKYLQFSHTVTPSRSTRDISTSHEIQTHSSDTSVTVSSCSRPLVNRSLQLTTSELEEELYTEKGMLHPFYRGRCKSQHIHVGSAHQVQMLPQLRFCLLSMQQEHELMDACQKQIHSNPPQSQAQDQDQDSLTFEQNVEKKSRKMRMSSSAQLPCTNSLAYKNRVLVRSARGRFTKTGLENEKEREKDRENERERPNDCEDLSDPTLLIHQADRKATNFDNDNDNDNDNELSNNETMDQLSMNLSTTPSSESLASSSFVLTNSTSESLDPSTQTIEDTYSHVQLNNNNQSQTSALLLDANRHSSFVDTPLTSMSSIDMHDASGDMDNVDNDMDADTTSPQQDNRFLGEILLSEAESLLGPNPGGIPIWVPSYCPDPKAFSRVLNLAQSCFADQEEWFDIERVLSLFHASAYDSEATNAMLKPFIPPEDTEEDTRDSEPSFPGDDLCFICHDVGVVIVCELCPKVFHPHCVNLEKIPTGAWACSHHSCSNCRTKLTDSLLSCSTCLASYCQSHLPARLHDKLIQYEISEFQCSRCAETDIKSVRKLKSDTIALAERKKEAALAAEAEAEQAKQIAALKAKHASSTLRTGSNKKAVQSELAADAAAAALASTSASAQAVKAAAEAKVAAQNAKKAANITDQLFGKQAFYSRLLSLLKRTGDPLRQTPTLDNIELDLYTVYAAFIARGGFVHVLRTPGCLRIVWESLGLRILPPYTPEQQAQLKAHAANRKNEGQVDTNLSSKSRGKLGEIAFLSQTEIPMSAAMKKEAQSLSALALDSLEMLQLAVVYFDVLYRYERRHFTAGKALTASEIQQIKSAKDKYAMQKSTAAGAAPVSNRRRFRVDGSKSTMSGGASNETASPSTATTSQKGQSVSTNTSGKKGISIPSVSATNKKKTSAPPSSKPGVNSVVNSATASSSTPLPTQPTVETNVPKKKPVSTSVNNTDKKPAKDKTKTAVVTSSVSTGKRKATSGPNTLEEDTPKRSRSSVNTDDEMTEDDADEGDSLEDDDDFQEEGRKKKTPAKPKFAPSVATKIQPPTPAPVEDNDSEATEDESVVEKSNSQTPGATMSDTITE